MLKVISEPHNPDTTAQLAALGYGLVFKKHRLERRNYETVLNNYEFVQQLLCHKLTFRPLTTVVTDDIRCVINNTTVTEEHNNGGVMCITFLHETDETCIVAPHQLRIKDVYNVWLSFDGFETAIRHSQKHSDGFIVGLQDVRVTGVMPINFDDQQWKDLGSKYLKLAARAAVAGNMAAFTDLQAQTLPILVWMFSYLAGPISWRIELDPLLRASCKHIDPARATNFISCTYKYRLPDWEPSLEVFVSRLILAEIDLASFVFPVFEEYMRRNKFPDVTQRNWLFYNG
ncbi:unnamed protein product [Sphagnum jensenii]|uniref:Uncharacterized protein n=1 Tax=Sphagnum jensenii TaxID=128206 RepID=A0ABP0VIY7_9BRYO